MSKARVFGRFAFDFWSLAYKPKKEDINICFWFWILPYAIIQHPVTNKQIK
jgi:hypothetical protein